MESDAAVSFFNFFFLNQLSATTAVFLNNIFYLQYLSEQWPDAVTFLYLLTVYRFALVSSPFWGCNYTADDDGWLTTAADELCVFCRVRFTSVPLRERCCLRLKGENPLMNNSPDSARQGGGEWGENPLSVLEMTYQVDDVMPREGCWWCHLLIWYTTVKLLVWLFGHNLFFSHLFFLFDA